MKKMLFGISVWQPATATEKFLDVRDVAANVCVSVEEEFSFFIQLIGSLFLSFLPRQAEKREWASWLQAKNIQVVHLLS